MIAGAFRGVKDRRRPRLGRHGGYADNANVRLPRPLIVALVASTVAACASSGGVPRPRPFPGAALPPEREAPRQAGAPAPTPVPAPAQGQVPTPVPIPDTARAELVATALMLRGVPYRNGGSDPSGFDCSGFMQYVFAQHATRLPRETAEQYRVGERIDLRDAQPGDLLFFETVSKGASHVGMVIGGEQFVHAPSSRGVVRVESYTASYWASRFLGARRVVPVQSTR